MKSWKTDGGYSVLMDFSNPVPPLTVTAKTTAEALAHLDAYAQEAAKTGQSLMCSIRLGRGERAPSGFRKANTQRFVNHQVEPDA
jgi:hypothetical protein